MSIGKNKIILTLLLVMNVNIIVEAQSGVPTPPPGFNQGPARPFDLKIPKSGELLVKVTSFAKSSIREEFFQKKGFYPSKRQLNKFLAKKFGLRISKEIFGASAFFVKGKRTNLVKISNVINQGLAEVVDSNYRVYAFNELNDYFYQFGLLWSLDHPLGLFTSEFDYDVDAVEAWRITAGSSNMIVAVIDTGISMDHPDLVANIWNNPFEIPNNGRDDDRNGFIDDINGWDFANNDNDPEDDNLHGSHCSGIISAQRNNNRGIAGVAPNVKILPLKVLGAGGEGDTAGLVSAIAYVNNLRKKGFNVRVINASLGGGDRTELLKEVLQESDKQGILFVSASGNDGSNNDLKPIYPASYGREINNVIAVGSTDFFGRKSSFSNYGIDSVHVFAPGSLVWSTIIEGLYLPLSGTSMAAPHVAGVAALAFSRYPNMSPRAMRDHLMNSVKPNNNLRGYSKAPGIISAYQAVGGN